MMRPALDQTLGRASRNPNPKLHNGLRDGDACVPTDRSVVDNFVKKTRASRR